MDEIDHDFKKSEKEMAAHILANLPKRGYKTLKEMIKMEDNYLNDVEKVKKQVAKQWKSKYRKKRSSFDSDSSSESSRSSSSDSSSDDEMKQKSKKKKKRRDQYALNVDDVKKDTCNQYGVIQCGHCGKPGHGIAICWELHDRPANFNNNRRNRNGNNNTSGRTPKSC